MFKLCPKEFCEIPSNSPLTNRPDTVISKMENGIEPKNRMPNNHRESYNSNMANSLIWKRKFYNQKKIKEILKDEFNSITKLWVDFETWYTKYVSR